MTERDERALAGSLNGCVRSLWRVLRVKTGVATERAGRCPLLRRKTAWFIRFSVPVALPNFLLPPYLSTPIMLNGRQESTAPTPAAAPASNAPAGKLFNLFNSFSLCSFWLVRVDRGVVGPGRADNTASCPQMGLFCASAQSPCVCVPKFAQHTTPLRCTTGLLSPLLLLLPLHR